MRLLLNFFLQKLKWRSRPGSRRTISLSCLFDLFCSEGEWFDPDYIFGINSISNLLFFMDSTGWVCVVCIPRRNHIYSRAYYGISLGTKWASVPILRRQSSAVGSCIYSVQSSSSWTCGAALCSPCPSNLQSSGTHLTFSAQGVKARGALNVWKVLGYHWSSRWNITRNGAFSRLLTYLVLQSRLPSTWHRKSIGRVALTLSIRKLCTFVVNLIPELCLNSARGHPYLQQCPSVRGLILLSSLCSRVEKLFIGGLACPIIKHL